MATVYRIDENILSCFMNGLNYLGFEKGAEACIYPVPFTVCGNTINPGDSIKGFDSGSPRTSFQSVNPITYVGQYGSHVLFSFEEEQKDARQAKLFDEPQKPVWYLAFALVSETAGLLMFSQPGACYDIRPLKIIQP